MGNSSQPLINEGTSSRIELSYGNHGQKLDVYPQPTGSRAAVALVVHGGGWSGGDRHFDLPYIPNLVAAGVVVVAISYRLAPAHPWPACLEDVQEALEWTRANAEQYGGDAKRMVVVGHSAGGHLALHVAMSESGTSLAGMVGMAAPCDLVLDCLRRGEISLSLKQLFAAEQVDAGVLDLLWQHSPINHVRPGLPPCLLIHGDNDPTVPLQQSNNLQQRMRAVGTPCQLIKLAGMGHAIHDWFDHQPEVLDAMATWIRQPSQDLKPTSVPSTLHSGVSDDAD